ncbi:MAG TPA: hypothetical protein VML01_00690 [Bryobacterales bacterium]|nr:hypothetical protein [Bryobacterales bacterium]
MEPLDPGEGLEKALAHMQVALEALDQAAAPADICAHLDLAICRLREAISEAEVQPSPLSQKSSATTE